MGEFSSLELTLCADSFLVFVPPNITTVARKRPCPFCQKCRWQATPKHTYTLDPAQSELADYAAVQAQCASLSGNELTCNSSENTQPQSSQLAELLWTDPGLKRGISKRVLISIKKKKKCRRGMNDRTISPNPRKPGKSYHHHYHSLTVST